MPFENLVPIYMWRISFYIAIFTKKLKCEIDPIITVNRMVKYTGYGNCAGLLANRGLMLGGQGQGDYSSDSEDSETEEYSNLANM